MTALTQDDFGFGRALRVLGRLTLLAVVIGTGMLYSCGNDDSNLSDCSRRERPQYRDSNGNWTCK